jgi:hypothetical protein
MALSLGHLSPARLDIHRLVPQQLEYFRQPGSTRVTLTQARRVVLAYQGQYIDIPACRLAGRSNPTNSISAAVIGCSSQRTFSFDPWAAGIRDTDRQTLTVRSTESLLRFGLRLLTADGVGTVGAVPSIRVRRCAPRLRDDRRAADYRAAVPPAAVPRYAGRRHANSHSVLSGPIGCARNVSAPAF